MKRFRFVLTLAGLLACSTLAGLAAGADPPPNLLVIHTDEHNFRTLGCYRELLSEEQALMWGDAVVTTPHVDWLAEHGAICTSFYATTPVCSPSRGAFVSGWYPQNTPVVTNNIPMVDRVVTFAEVLRRAGYATGYAGKWHLDGTGKPQWAPQRKFGFDELQQTPEGPRVKARGGGRPSYAVQGADAESFTTDFLADRTVEFIESHRTGPFCYMVSFPDPHGPDTVRPPFDTMFQDQTYRAPRTFNKPTEGLPSWGRPDGKFLGMAAYYGMVKCIDENVGKILEALRSAGVMERTVVVFTADHGDLRGEHHRQNKGVPYEGSARIPFVIYYPGKIAPGTVIDEALGCVDFPPTILGLLGCRSDLRPEGRDASALFLTGKPPVDWTDVTFVRGTGEVPGWLAAVSDRYKLVYSTRDDPWLFDLEEDPDELVNRFRDPACRETVRELSRQLAAYGARCKDPRMTDAKIRADVAWAVSGTGPYVSSPAVPQVDRPARGRGAKPGAGGKRRPRSQ